MYETIKRLINAGYSIEFAPDFKGTLRITLSERVNEQLKRCEVKATLEFMENTTFEPDKLFEIMINKLEERINQPSLTVNHPNP